MVTSMSLFCFTHGLNDYVVARMPLDPTVERRMAHDRQPDPGYMQCLAPNARVGSDRSIEIRERRVPLTAEGIQECERLWAERVKRFP